MYPQLSLQRQAGTGRCEEALRLMQLAELELQISTLALASRDPAKFLKG